MQEQEFLQLFKDAEFSNILVKNCLVLLHCSFVMNQISHWDYTLKLIKDFF